LHELRHGSLLCPSKPLHLFRCGCPGIREENFKIKVLIPGQSSLHKFQSLVSPAAANNLARLRVASGCATPEISKPLVGRYFFIRLQISGVACVVYRVA